MSLSKKQREQIERRAQRARWIVFADVVVEAGMARTDLHRACLDCDDEEFRRCMQAFYLHDPDAAAALMAKLKQLAKDPKLAQRYIKSGRV